MPTLSQTATAFEEQHFTGRERELAVFQHWISSGAESPTILSVCGPGGAGKSALLRAFARLARAAGRRVVVADGELAPLTPVAVLQALAGAIEPDGVPHLELAQPVVGGVVVVLIDAFDRRAELWRSILEEFLPTLSSSLKVVVAGRSQLQLGWNRQGPYQHLVLPMLLQRFTQTESLDYLEQCGIHDPRLLQQIIWATGGNPLALSLAADLVLKLDVRNLVAAPEWRLNVHRLLEHILHEVSDPQLRALLDVFAIAHHVDESTLVSMSGSGNCSSLFDQLCRLSIVRPAEHGLSLHEDVRRLLAQDLQWRQPSRHAAMWKRALEHFQERALTAPPADAEWLLTERLSVSPNQVAAGLVFDAEEAGQVSVGPAHADDGPAIQRMWEGHLARAVTPDGPGLTVDENLERDFLGEVLRYPGTRARVVRARDGHLLGFSTAVPVCRESVGLLNRHPAFGKLVHTSWGPAGLAALPARPDASDILYFVHLGHSTELGHAVRATLLCAYFGHFARPGLYLAYSPFPADQAAFEGLGFEHVGAARTCFWGDAHPAEGFVLDLGRCGLERWLEVVDRGERTGPVASVHDSLDQFTRRERDIVLLLARGRTTNRELAAELFITKGTANLHVKHILSKLSLATRAQVAAWAAEEGLSSVVMRPRPGRTAGDRGVIPFPALPDAALYQQRS